MGLLDGKVAVISGVGPGLGRATALAFAREGASLALAARNEERLSEIVAEVEALGVKAIGVPTDVVDVEACERICAEAKSVLGGIDIVVNSAFRGDTFTRFEDANMNTWHKIFEVNFFGAMNLTKSALPYMRERGAGSVVMVASMSARKIRDAEAGYAASKGALLVATKSLASEFAVDKIRVNAVVPGWIWGPNVQMYVDWQSQSRSISKEEVIAEITREIPLGEVPPQEDIAEAILFFASGMSRMITGQSLDVNGGEYFG